MCWLSYHRKNGDDLFCYGQGPPDLQLEAYGDIHGKVGGAGGFT